MQIFDFYQISNQSFWSLILPRNLPKFIRNSNRHIFVQAVWNDIAS